MKIQILIVVLAILPFLGFSQQSNVKIPGAKKETKVVVIKKDHKNLQVHNQRPNYFYTEEYRIANGIPNDFPRYIETGNPKLDGENYYEAKQAWIKSNPDRFEKIKHLSL